MADHDDGTYATLNGVRVSTEDPKAARRTAMEWIAKISDNLDKSKGRFDA